MMNGAAPHQAYQQELTKHLAGLAVLKKKRSTLGWLRFAVFLATVAAAYFVFTRYGLAGLLPTGLGLAALLFLVSADVRNNTAIRNTETLVRINEEEVKALAHQFQFREDGRQFIPAEHPYAGDLDIFGPASLYQWLSRCHTEQGKQRLAANLLSPLPVSVVHDRQAAVAELAPLLGWRQQWQAFAMQTAITSKIENRILTWLGEKEEFFSGPGWKVFLTVYSVLTTSSALAALLGYLPGPVFSMLYLLYLITSLLLSRKALLPYLHLGGVVKETGTLQALVNWLESLSATSPHLLKVQGELKANGTFAGNELRELKKILDRFDLRNNIVGLLVFNAFLLWDLRQLRALNGWRRRNKSGAKKWFEALAEMDVLHSVSTLRFNYPDWCIPQLTAGHFTLEVEQLGHPLLPEPQRVNNNFTLSGQGKISLITGSNMAGKSTFLRSLGVNVVLAQLGAPVCANRLLLSPVQLASSMRIADNLAENTSTFYAELKKLRSIIERVKARERVFILLDEILRGTNSFDRHTGAAALVKQLIRESAVAVIATHDVELAQLEKAYPTAIENYHFDVEVDGEELYFDYKLKPGICKSLNASILMKKIGIDL